MYLIQDSMDSKFAGLMLLTDGSAAGPGLSQFFTSTGAPPVHSSDSGFSKASTSSASSAWSQPTAAPPLHGAKPAETPVSRPASVVRPVAVAPAPVTSATPLTQQEARKPSVPSSSTASSNGPTKRRVVTSVDKGEQGIGLDLGKTKEGAASVLRLKDFPPDVVNPASLCSPAILPGDVIVAVNGQACATFADAVKLIRATGSGSVQLTLERL